MNLAGGLSLKSAAIATSNVGIPTPRPTLRPILSPRSIPCLAGQLHVGEAAVDVEVGDGRPADVLMGLNLQKSVGSLVGLQRTIWEELNGY
jgi:hypothetical protein